MATAEQDVIPLTQPAIKELNRVFELQRNASRNSPIMTRAERKAALVKLKNAVRDRQDDIVAALNKDFGNRARHETLVAELMVLMNEINHSIRHLRRWMKPKKPLVDWQYLPARARVIQQPLGVVGIIGAWNYPVQLTFGPLVGALAAGNRAILKPSELSPASGEIMADIISDIFTEDQVTVINGGADVAAEFSSLPFDHLFFTGSTRVGKIIMRAASENLTPVTLELGGKSPAIFGKDCNMKQAAERMMWGKMLNSGQTCVAPDYVLVEKSREQELLEAIKAGAHKMYPAIAGNEDYTWILTERHLDRLRTLVSDAEKQGATAEAVYDSSAEPEGSRIMAPVALRNVTDDMTVMQEEIFGPILPIMTYETIDEAIAYVNANDRPLALYYFGRDRQETKQILEQTVSGGVTLNDTMCHLPQGNMPFGGVGPSGMGHYHGEYGFKTFTKEKAVFMQSRLFRAPDLLKAPYGKMANFLLRFFIGKPKALPNKKG